VQRIEAEQVGRVAKADLDSSKSVSADIGICQSIGVLVGFELKKLLWALECLGTPEEGSASLQLAHVSPECHFRC
jgi:hypothetical protein